MSQVRKLQKGDKIPTAKKYATFTIDGNAFDVDDDFLGQLTNYGKGIEDERTRNQFSKITDALRNGENLSYNSNSNTLDGNVAFDVTDNQGGRLSKRRSRVGQALGNAWGGKETQARHAVNALSGFTYTKPKEQKKINHHDWSADIQMEYGTDKDGKKTYVRGANNNRAIQRIRDLAGIVAYGEDDKFTGYGDLDKQAYINWYNSIGEQGANDIIQRLESGAWDDNDAEMLNDIGIHVKSNEPTQTPQTVKTESETYTPEIEGSGSSQSSNTNISNFNPSIFDQLGYGEEWTNAYFGENFINRIAAANPGLDWLRDHILYNGKLYSKDQWSNQNSDIYKTLNSPDVDIFNRMRQNLFSPEQNGGWQVLWTNNPYNRYNPQTQYNKHFAENYANDNNVMYSYTTPLYQNAPEGYNIMDIIDSATQRNEFGLPIGRKTIALDAEGNLSDIDLGKYTRTNSFNGEATGNAFQHMIANGRYKGWLWRDLMGDDNDGDGQPDYQGWSILRNRETGNEAYYDHEKKRVYDPSTDEANLSHISYNGKRLSELDYIPGNIIQAMRNMIDRSALARSTIARGLYSGSGLSQWSSSRWENIPLNRDQLGIPGYQTGGLINWKSTDKANSGQKTNVRDLKKTASGKQVLSGDLTSADKLQLGALAADLGALIAAIPTGGNPIAAGLGVGGTTAQLAADIKRDGFDLKDLGNAAIGYGLDAITFLPGVGIAGKLGKTAQIIKRVKPLLTTLFSGAGITAGLSSLNKEGEWTLDDYRNILSGIQGVIGGKRVFDRKVGFKSTKAPVGKTEKLSAQKLGDIQRQSIDKLVSESPDKFSDRSWTSTDADGKVKVTDHTAAMNDIDIKNTLPTNRFYQESLSKIRAAAGNAGGAFENFFIGKGRRFRTEEELPWFLRNQFGRSWMRNAQAREFGNMVYRMPNREDYEMTYNTRIINNLKQNNNFIRAWRSSWADGVKEGRQVYINPRLVGSISGLNPQIRLSTPVNPPLSMTVHPSSGGAGYHKKGGIIKAHNGILIDPISVSAQQRQLSQLPSTIKLGPAPQLDQDIIRQNSLAAYKSRLAMNTPTPIQQGNIVNTQRIVGQPIEKFNLNLNKDMILGGLDYLISKSAINRGIREELKGNDLAARGQLRPIRRILGPRQGGDRIISDANTRRAELQNNVNVYSDPSMVMSNNLMRSMLGDQIMNEANSKYSQYLDNYNAQLLASQQAQLDSSWETAVHNNSVMGNKGLNDAMIRSKGIIQNAQNNKSLIYQLRQDLGTDLKRQEMAQAQVDQLGMQVGYQKGIQDFIASKNQEYESWKIANPELAKTTSLSQWVQENYPGDLANLQYNTYSKFIANQPNRSPRFWLHGDDWSNINYKLPQLSNPEQPSLDNISVFSHKRGGRLTNTTGRIRPVGDQHYLDQQKAISKAIGDMNNNIVKLFIKMMS